ncbi:MAG: DNA translocase FtsK [Candidatus Binataceae bacterium]
MKSSGDTIPLSAETELAQPNLIVRELGALALAALASFAALSLVCLDNGRATNLGGPVCDIVARAVSFAVGVQSYALIALVVYGSIRLWRATDPVVLAREVAGGLVLVASLATATGLVWRGDPAWGGLIGTLAAGQLIRFLNVGGGYIAVGFALVCGLALMLKRAPTELVAGAASAVRPILRRGDEYAYAPDTPIALSGIASASDARSPSRSTPLTVRRLDLREASRDKASKDKSVPRTRGGYKLPVVTILDAPPSEHAQVDESQLERSARVLEQKLADFGVEGRVVEVQPGPVVTMYKFEPGSGIKVSQIVNLADDLSMALRAAAVRILAPVPGEAVVGIEVPNRKRERVFLREILEADEFASAQGHLAIALGKDIAGRPHAADLGRMPHLLIAGATGTGKSVSIHTMIASILFNATADDVRFILIDPKMLELSVYEGIPHLLVPVVVDPEKAAATLLWATQEMERRYLLMRDLGVRNIDGYNRALASRASVVELKPQHLVSEGILPASAAASEPLEHHKLPKIVIVIDELADLLLSEGKTVERDITRLAQKARAAGIHLILATQRPSVDVITGLIKANLPARISFQVTSRVDSRTILDAIGAERLLGAGDMLFMPPGTARIVRLHGPFVSEQEIRRLADFLRAQGAPDYQMEILETRLASDDEGGPADGEKDEMYDEAVQIVMETNQASISMIQRRLRIGYNRAARMVEQMEREGLVMPQDGARPREVRIARGVR